MLWTQIFIKSSELFDYKKIKTIHSNCIPGHAWGRACTVLCLDSRVGTPTATAGPLGAGLAQCLKGSREIKL